mgnify:CR=1 FL=1
MCLAVPAQIISLDGMTAVAEMSGIKKEIDVTLTPEVAPRRLGGGTCWLCLTAN